MAHAVCYVSILWQFFLFWLHVDLLFHVLLIVLESPWLSHLVSRGVVLTIKQ